MHDMTIWHKYLAETFNGQRVNYALLEKLRPPTGGFTKEIIEAIGEKWPVHGNAWVKRCIGNEFKMKATSGHGKQAAGVSVESHVAPHS